MFNSQSKLRDMIFERGGLTKMFRMIDEDKSGQCTRLELRQLVLNLNLDTVIRPVCGRAVPSLSRVAQHGEARGRVAAPRPDPAVCPRRRRGAQRFPYAGSALTPDLSRACSSCRAVCLTRVHPPLRPCCRMTNECALSWALVVRAGGCRGAHRPNGCRRRRQHLVQGVCARAHDR